MRIALLLVVALVGCDTKAKSDTARPENKSKEYESCGTTSHCDGDLRCLDHVCRRTARSTVGDYFAAVGAAAKARGDGEAAVTAYAAALGHYDSEKLALPPDVDCAYGGALAAAGKTKKEHAELGARVLHRCLLAAPVGGALRDRALADLASLADAGLNPLALGGSKLADLYLTAAPVAPPPSGPMGVTVTASPTPTGKSFELVTDKLAEADTKAALIACATTYLANTKKDALVAVVGVKVAYIPSQYDDEDGHFAIAIDPPSPMPAGTPEASADTCVHSVVDPSIKGLSGVRDNFATKLTITIK